MFKEDNYEQIFSNKINHQNIEIIKKLFVFEPSQFDLMKPCSTIVPNPKNTISPQGLSYKKNLPKFPAGFHNPKSTQLILDNECQQKYMILKSKKVQTHEVNSFLLGLNHRIAQQSEIKDCPNEECKATPEKRVSYEEVMSNLNKIRRENRNKFAASLQTNNTSNLSQQSASNSNKTELPQLEKRMSNPVKRTICATSNCFTPVLQNKESSRTHENRKFNSFRGNTESKSVITATKFSSKIIRPFDQPVFMKGYLAYDPKSKEFLENNIENIGGGAVLKKKIVGVTANNYLIVNCKNLTVIAQKLSDESIEIASLTKIMTCYLCLLVCVKYSVNINELQVRVSDKAAEMTGTSAELQAGDLIKLKDLLYGLMLPSGNDASVAVAETCGKIIQKYKKKPSRKTYYETFIGHMNLLAKELNIDQTYQNSSGLSLNPNMSTPKAITILTALAMNNEVFRAVINEKQYETQIKNERFGLTRKVTWRNTNKLLWKGWQGVKTGTTETAGHCLMSYRENLLVSVFNCQTLNRRFTECVKLYEMVTNSMEAN